LSTGTSKKTLINLLFQRFPKNIRRRGKAVICLLLAAICAVVYLPLLAQIVRHQDSYHPAQADAILVLGYAINANNEPSDWLLTRLQTGLELYRGGYAGQIIVSGGRGPRDKTTVASSMERWLLAKGVPPKDIITEERACDTEQNFIYAKRLADERDIRSVIVVTNDFHMYRSMTIARDYFAQAYGQAADVPFGFQKALAYLKEPLSLIKHYIIDFLRNSIFSVRS